MKIEVMHPSPDGEMDSEKFNPFGDISADYAHAKEKDHVKSSADKDSQGISHKLAADLLADLSEGSMHMVNQASVKIESQDSHNESATAPRKIVSPSGEMSVIGELSAKSAKKVVEDNTTIDTEGKEAFDTTGHGIDFRKSLESSYCR